ncbi:phytoene desaturase family protein [Crocosphaera sp. Alani8]|uniref:phytoene desaturase family protein n=1 Tax=Crocosphaera sp. Alani8 TaxID=3038952 RepID=UPI00313D5A9E
MTSTILPQTQNQSSETITEQFDVIVIGSGMGGMTTASLLSQLEGKRVLLLERHFQVGGFTHTFKRHGNLEWDVGLHYVGEVEQGSVPRAIFDFITQGQVKWQPMPDVYDRLVFPHFTHDVRKGRKHLIAGLIDRFPHENLAIQQYFKDLDRAYMWLELYTVTQMMTGKLWFLARLIRKWGEKYAQMTTGEYMNSHFTDPKLKAVLLGQWGLYGLPPCQSAFVGHALLVRHYMEGGYFPVGGSATIAESIVPTIEAQGGKVLKNHSVEEILIKENQVIGVRAFQKKGKRSIEKIFLANTVISDAGAYKTYTSLIPQEIKLPCRMETKKFPNGTANVTVYLGLKSDPKRFGFQGENYWIYSDYDHDDIHACRNELVNGQVNHAFLSFPSLKNPVAKGHTAEIIAFIDADSFNAWDNKPWRHRGGDYEELKTRIGNSLVEFVNEHFPGFAEQIEYLEVGTPITTTHFTNHRNGNIYGLPMVPEKFQNRWFSPKTPIQGLYLTGSDAALFGVCGAMTSGLLSAAMATKKPWKLVTMVARAIKYSNALKPD